MYVKPAYRLSPELHALARKSAPVGECETCHSEVSADEMARPCRYGYHGRHVDVRR